MTTIELALYMPILLLVIFLTVQFALVYLGNQAAQAVARETARVARVTHDWSLAEHKGQVYAANIGQGMLEEVAVDVRPQGDWVRVVVTGHAQELVPVGVPEVRQVVEGPVEEFRPG